MMYMSQITFYNANLELRYAFGTSTVYYTYNNGQKNFLFFKDEYDFDLKKPGDRTKFNEFITFLGSFIPGKEFKIYLYPFNNE